MCVPEHLTSYAKRQVIVLMTCVLPVLKYLICNIADVRAGVSGRDGAEWWQAASLPYVDCAGLGLQAVAEWPGYRARQSWQQCCLCSGTVLV